MLEIVYVDGHRWVEYDKIKVLVQEVLGSVKAHKNKGLGISTLAKLRAIVSEDGFVEHVHKGCTTCQNNCLDPDSIECKDCVPSNEWVNWVSNKEAI